MTHENEIKADVQSSGDVVSHWDLDPLSTQPIDMSELLTQNSPDTDPS